VEALTALKFEDNPNFKDKVKEISEKGLKKLRFVLIVTRVQAMVRGFLSRKEGYNSNVIICVFLAPY